MNLNAILSGSTEDYITSSHNTDAINFGGEVPDYLAKFGTSKMEQFKLSGKSKSHITHAQVKKALERFKEKTGWTSMLSGSNGSLRTGGSLCQYS